jgi:hypothetical protein
MRRRTLVLLGVALLLALGAGIAYAATDGVSSGSGWVTQRGTFTVPVGQTGGSATLPLTGITLAGRCVLNAQAPSVVAYADLHAAEGKTMDAFVPAGGGAPTIGGTSATTYVAAEGESATTNGGVARVIASSNDAIATTTVGGVADWPSQTCTFMWQALEVPTGDSSPPGEPVPVPGAPGGLSR